MGDVTYLGNRTILYDGHILSLGDTNDGWEVMNAINRYEREKQEEIDKAVERALKRRCNHPKWAKCSYCWNGKEDLMKRMNEWRERNPEIS